MRVATVGDEGRLQIMKEKGNKEKLDHPDRTFWRCGSLRIENVRRLIVYGLLEEQAHVQPWSQILLG